jgi:hypothetical protein
LYFIGLQLTNRHAAGTTVFLAHQKPETKSMKVTLRSLAIEDAAALADVEKDIEFLNVAGRGDGLAVLALIDKTLDGGEDPRLLAGLDALRRILARPHST